MKLIRFGDKGNERPGLLQGDGIVDLTAVFDAIPDVGEAFFRDGWLHKAAGVRESGRIRDVRIGCPVARPSKIICLGKNYAEHAQEGGFDQPQRPLLFSKGPNTLNGPTDAILLPQSSGQVDWEVELAVVIGREGRRIAAANAYTSQSRASLRPVFTHSCLGNPFVYRVTCFSAVSCMK